MVAYLYYAVTIHGGLPSWIVTVFFYYRRIRNGSWKGGSHPFPPEKEPIRKDYQHIVVPASKAGINRVLSPVSADERSSESLDSS